MPYCTMSANEPSSVTLWGWTLAHLESETSGMFSYLPFIVYSRNKVCECE